MSDIMVYIAILIYIALGSIALWGAFCVIVVWMRVAKTRFRDDEEQNEFLDQVDEALAGGDFNAAAEICDQDDRAMSQLALMAITNRQIGYAKLRSIVAEHFQRDVLADLEFRLSWIYTVIKAAPMVGLLGTVVGMMGAFAKLAGGGESGENVDPTQLAGDIQLALITTACGLSIAIPLVLSTASINVRIRKMEDLVSMGLTRFFETFKTALIKADEQEQ